MSAALLQDALAAASGPVEVWWRDDDAGRPCPALERLLSNARRLDLPVALAVVPAWLDTEAAQTILAYPRAVIWQHGWTHANHARPGQRKIELGGVVATARLVDEVERGRAILGAGFGERFEPVMVPPWNRIEQRTADRLALLGFAALSTLHPGPAFPVRLARCDVHLDVMDWRRRSVLPVEELCAGLAGIIRLGVRGVGLMTHHLEMDEAGWIAFEALLEILRRNDRTAFVRRTIPPGDDG